MSKKSGRGPKSSVTPHECGMIREFAKRGQAQRELAGKYGVTHQTIAYHAKGDCHCDTNIAPVESFERMVSEDECRMFRQEVRDGKSSYTLAEEHDFTRQTITRHAYGRCSHDIDEPAHEWGASADMCREIRELAHGGESYQSISESMDDIAYSTVVQHGAGRCSHDLDIAPVEARKQARIPPHVCHNIRLMYHDGLSNEEIKEAVKEHADMNIKRREIRYHGMFQCDHEVPDE